MEIIQVLDPVYRCAPEVRQQTRVDPRGLFGGQQVLLGAPQKFRQGVLVVLRHLLRPPTMLPIWRVGHCARVRSRWPGLGGPTELRGGVVGRLHSVWAVGRIQGDWGFALRLRRAVTHVTAVTAVTASTALID